MMRRPQVAAPGTPSVPHLSLTRASGVSKTANAELLARHGASDAFDSDDDEESLRFQEEMGLSPRKGLHGTSSPPSRSDSGDVGRAQNFSPSLGPRLSRALSDGEPPRPLAAAAALVPAAEEAKSKRVSLLDRLKSPRGGPSSSVEPVAAPVVGDEESSSIPVSRSARRITSLFAKRGEEASMPPAASPERRSELEARALGGGALLSNPVPNASLVAAPSAGTEAASPPRSGTRGLVRRSPRVVPGAAAAPDKRESPRFASFAARRSKSSASLHESLSPVIEDEFSEPGLFGMALDDLLALNKPSDSGVVAPVPDVMEILIRALRDAGGFGAEGIFRLSTGTAVRRAAMLRLHRFDYDNLDTDDPAAADAHLYSSLLKEWFKRLPAPLIVDYEACLAMARAPETESTALVAQLCAAMAPSSRAVLERLMAFVEELAEHVDETRMTARNLCIVFAPGLVRPARDQSALDMLRDQPQQLLALERIYRHVRGKQPGAEVARVSGASPGSRTSTGALGSAGPEPPEASSSLSSSPSPPPVRVLEMSTPLEGLDL